MHSEMNGALLDGAKRVCSILKANSFQSYLVGGCVRDSILGREPKDYDITTDATPDQVRRLFDHTVMVGEAFGVVRVRMNGFEYEIATFRRDGEYADGRHPESVTFATAEEDVRRRDFTINALLMDPGTGEIIDHVGGRDDIARRVIRAVGNPVERFREDRLRMLRAVRFAAQLGFQIEPATLEAIISRRNLQGVSLERITEELTKIWRSPYAGIGFSLLRTTNLDVEAIPYIAKYSTINNTFSALDTRAKEYQLTLDQKEAVAWAFTCNWSRSYNETIEQELRTYLRLSNAMIDRVMKIVKSTPILKDDAAMRSAAGIRLLLHPDVNAFLAFQASFFTHNLHALSATSEMLLRLTTDPPDTSIVPTGRDLIALGHTPGPSFGPALRAAEDAVLEGIAKSKDEAMAIALETLVSNV